MSDPTAEANGRKPKILWGITASVAAIRAVKLADCLTPLGAVQAIVTQKAKHFLPSDFSLRVPTFDDHSEWESWRDLGDPVLHIELRRWADILVVSPLTADALGKMTAGICDNLLLSTIRAWDYSKPLIVAPAMNTYMWEHPLTARQLDQLREWGATVVDPVEKTLACADVGMGALADAEVIAQHVADAIQARRAAAIT